MVDSQESMSCNMMETNHTSEDNTMDPPVDERNNVDEDALFLDYLIDECLAADSVTFAAQPDSAGDSRGGSSTAAAFNNPSVKDEPAQNDEISETGSGYLGAGGPATVSVSSTPKSVTCINNHYSMDVDQERWPLSPPLHQNVNQGGKRQAGRQANRSVDAALNKRPRTTESEYEPITEDTPILVLGTSHKKGNAPTATSKIWHNKVRPVQKKTITIAEVPYYLKKLHAEMKKSKDIAEPDDWRAIAVLIPTRVEVEKYYARQDEYPTLDTTRLYQLSTGDKTIVLRFASHEYIKQHIGAKRSQDVKRTRPTEASSLTEQVTGFKGQLSEIPAFFPRVLDDWIDGDPLKRKASAEFRLILESACSVAESTRRRDPELEQQLKQYWIKELKKLWKKMEKAVSQLREIDEHIQSLRFNRRDDPDNHENQEGDSSKATAPNHGPSQDKGNARKGGGDGDASKSKATEASSSHGSKLDLARWLTFVWDGFSNDRSSDTDSCSSSDDDSSSNSDTPSGGIRASLSSVSTLSASKDDTTYEEAVNNCTSPVHLQGRHQQELPKEYIPCNLDPPAPGSPHEPSVFKTARTAVHNILGTFMRNCRIPSVVSDKFPIGMEITTALGRDGASGYKVASVLAIAKAGRPSRKNPLSGVVMIGVFDASGQHIVSVGSGFVADANLGLVVTASHILFHTQEADSGGPDHAFETLKGSSRAVIGVVPDGETNTHFHYLAHLVAHDDVDSGADACILRISSRLEEDIIKGKRSAAAATAIDDDEFSISKENLQALELTQKYVLGEPVQMVGFDQGGGGLFGLGKHALPPAAFQMTSGNVSGRIDSFDLGYPKRSARSCSSRCGEIVVDGGWDCRTLMMIGQSGGPCINRDGLVVGILSHGGPENQSFLVPASEIERLVNGVRENDARASNHTLKKVTLF